jgi:hypothetical protein
VSHLEHTPRPGTIVPVSRLDVLISALQQRLGPKGVFRLTYHDRNWHIEWRRDYAAQGLGGNGPERQCTGADLRELLRTVLDRESSRAL